jgi:hypothetical protein
MFRLAKHSRLDLKHRGPAWGGCEAASHLRLPFSLRFSFFTSRSSFLFRYGVLAIYTACSPCYYRPAT